MKLFTESYPETFVTRFVWYSLQMCKRDDNIVVVCSVSSSSLHEKIVNVMIVRCPLEQYYLQGMEKRDWKAVTEDT